jgi:4-hydroxy-tetrahydrodipicolinate synthase
MAMAKYRKNEAKEWARENIKGVWIATNTPFTPDFQVDWEGCRRNIRYFANDLQIKGNFHAGMVGETFHQTIAERKKHLEIAVEESRGKMITLSAPHCETPLVTLELAKYAEDIGAEMTGPMNPRFYQGTMTEEGVFQYFKWLSDNLNIAIYPLNQLEHGYLMSPQLICRMANEIPNFVGVKNIAPLDHTRMVRALCGDKIIVTDADEENWLMNLIMGRQPAYISSAWAFLLQTKKRPLINQYTALAEKGDFAGALEIYKKVEPIRTALVKVTPAGKRQATHKYWSHCLGLAGGEGRVRPPYQQLTQAEKDAIKAAVEQSGLL